MTSSAPKDARQKLDDAIREYATACDKDAAEKGAFMPIGWVLAVAGIRGSYGDDDQAGYLTETMPGQPWHAALGLWQHGHDTCRWNGDYS